MPVPLTCLEQQEPAPQGKALDHDVVKKVSIGKADDTPAQLKTSGQLALYNNLKDHVAADAVQRSLRPRTATEPRRWNWIAPSRPGGRTAGGVWWPRSKW